MNQKEKSDILDYLMEICAGNSVTLPDTIVWDTIWLIYWEWMNMEAKNGNKPKESLIIYSSEWLSNKSASHSEPRVKESIIEENKIDIVSKDTELSLKPITTDINKLIEEIKGVCDEYWLAYNKTRERQFAKHILTAKDYWEFAEKVWLDRVRLAKNIIVLSQKWWKWPCTWPEWIYKNYASVFNECKMQKQKEEKTQNNQVAIETDEI